MQVYQAMKQLYENENITPFKFEFNDKEQTLTCEQYDVPIKIKVYDFPPLMKTNEYTHIVEVLSDNDDDDEFVESLSRMFFKDLDNTWNTTGNVYNMILNYNDDDDESEQIRLAGLHHYTTNGGKWHLVKDCVIYKGKETKYRLYISTIEERKINDICCEINNNIFTSKECSCPDDRKSRIGKWSSFTLISGKPFYFTSILCKDKDEFVFTAE